MHDRTKAALRMILVRGLGIRSANALIRHFGRPEAVLDSNNAELEALGIPPDVAGDLLSSTSLERAERELEKAAQAGVDVLDMQHPQYPPLLREIFDPPIVLYIKGKSWDAGSPHLAIVGTRRPSSYGLNCAERLAEDLALRGLTIVSGLARGIDSAAHRGALRGGATCAVFGCGLDFIYPKENRKLAEFVQEKGAIISEFPLGTPPTPENFPIRNRIIAGISLGVTVVEAAEYSGSLITARLALEDNRDVFAVPGNITSANSFGPHVLIRQGAKLVTGWQDVVEELPYSIRERILAPLLAPVAAARTPAAETALAGAEKKVWEFLSPQDPVPIDTLLAKLQLDAAAVYGALLVLESEKFVRRLPGNRYIRRL